MLKRIPEAELRGMQERGEAAIEGPWSFYQINIHGRSGKTWVLDGDVVCSACGQDDGTTQIAEFDEEHEAAGIFCAHSRTDLPRFLAAIDAAYAEIDAQGKRIAELEKGLRELGCDLIRAVAANTNLRQAELLQHARARIDALLSRGEE